MELKSLKEFWNNFQCTLNSNQEHHNINREFEFFLTQLFRYFNIILIEPLKIIQGNGIIGNFLFMEHEWTLIAKWFSKPVTYNGILKLHIDNLKTIKRGIFLSLNDFDINDSERNNLANYPVLLWNKNHIQIILDEKITLEDMLTFNIEHTRDKKELPKNAIDIIDYKEKSILNYIKASCCSQVLRKCNILVGTYYYSYYVHREIETDIYQILADSLQSHNSFSKQQEIPNFYILLGKAGVGKTNVFCNLATAIAKSYPTFFLIASEIKGNIEIIEEINSELNEYLRKYSLDYSSFDQLLAIIKRQKSLLVIFIDGLSDALPPSNFNNLISNFINKILGLPVIVFASCNDIYFQFFDKSIWPVDNWSMIRKELGDFSIKERTEAINKYFNQYNISADLSTKAKERLAHPLMLRLFCDANSNIGATEVKYIPKVSDIRYLELLKLYYKNKIESLIDSSEGSPHSINADNIINYLASKMRQRKAPFVNIKEIQNELNIDNLNSYDSTFIRLLGTDVIRPTIDGISILFTYSEFMEYIIAKQMLTNNGITLEEDRIIQLFKECNNGLREFPAFIGVIEFLSMMLIEEYDFDIWNLLDFEMVFLSVAICRSIKKLNMTKKALNYINKSIKSQHNILRAEAIDSLFYIIRKESMEKSIRKSDTFDFLISIFNSCDNLLKSEIIDALSSKAFYVLNNSKFDKLKKWIELKKKNRSDNSILIFGKIERVSDLRELLKSNGYIKTKIEERASIFRSTLENSDYSVVIIDDDPEVSWKELVKKIFASIRLPINILLYSESHYNTYINIKDLFCGWIKRPSNTKEIIEQIELATLTGYKIK